MKAAYRTTGIFGVTLLALTACGPGDETADQDQVQESFDSDSAEDQGGSPEATAENGGQEQNGSGSGGTEGADERPAEDSAEVPQLADIEQEVWESSTNQESVTITGEASASLLGLPTPETEGDEQGQGSTEGDQAQVVDISAVGNLEGSGATYQVGEIFEYVVFDDDVYQSVDSIVAEYEFSQPEGTDAPEPDEIRAAFEAEGTWANWGEAGRDYLETPGEFISNFHEGFLSTSGMDSFAELGLTGEADSQDGEDVWVYQRNQGEDFIEMVVLSDQDEPLLRTLNYSLQGQQFSADFSDWNETDPPPRPAEAEVIAPQDAEAVLQSVTAQ